MVYEHKLVLHDIAKEPQPYLPVVIPQRPKRCPEFGCAKLTFKLASDETVALSGTLEDIKGFWTDLNRLQLAWNSAEIKRRSKESAK